MIDPRFEAATGPSDGLAWSGPPPETTGRQIVVFAEADDEPAIDWKHAGISCVADSRDFAGGEVSPEAIQDAQATAFAELGIAVVSADVGQMGALQAAAESRPVLSVSPELVHHVLHHDVEGYAQAYRDGVNISPAGSCTPTGPARHRSRPLPGVRCSRTRPRRPGASRRRRRCPRRGPGAGSKVAVLDTGFDLGNPDFAGRNVTAQSFVQGEPVQDGHGHGTHCIGTSCGPRTPSTGPRYGVAYEADIFAGKVLSNSGSGTDAGILAGINWAVANRCPVISMSLGATVQQAHPPHSAAGARALRRGSLIIAAAGNNADRRSGNFGFLGAPANSVEIMAVGALDMQLGMACFSARSVPARGGQVDIAGPGWQVYSSWPMPTRYRTISGTSMATPCVAGLAALWAEATGRRGLELWATLCTESERLLQPSLDVGSGLALAPR